MDREDKVVNPKHYVSNGIEAIDVIEAFNLNFHLGNVIKYVLRADRKGESMTDLRKAMWYLSQEIMRRNNVVIQEEIEEDTGP
jgi:hypothetical protein